MQLKDIFSGTRKNVGKKNRVIKVYVCGPTVYDEPHLGHLKTYITYDTLVKYLRITGHSVFYVQNITDLDDKIMNKAKELDMDPSILSKLYLLKYMDAMEKLGINAVNFYAPATFHINEIIRQIKRLEKKGFTYKLPDGIYFRVWMDKKYGELSGQRSEGLKKGTRAEVSDFKEDERDFVLWKFKKEDESLYWKSPWGLGRPGWHIEDTAIATKYLGNSYDIHGAGRDLLFPHHESELSIMRVLKGNSHMSDVWMYTGVLKINGDKMSKSTNNFTNVTEALMNYSAEELRMAFLSTLYSSELDFTNDLMDEARKNVKYISRAYDLLNEPLKIKEDVNLSEFNALFHRINSYMNNDLDTRRAIATLMEVAGLIYRYREQIGQELAKTIRGEIDNVNSYLGIIKINRESKNHDSLIGDIVKFRNNLRKEKRFSESDQIRNLLRSNGIELEDDAKGTGWHYE